MPPVSEDKPLDQEGSSTELQIVVKVIASCLLLFMLFLVIMGAVYLLEVPFRLIAGWALFLNEKLPHIRPDWSALVIGVLAYFISWGVMIGLLSRFRTYLPERVVQHRTRTAGVALLGFMSVFLAGISMIGIVHQFAWMPNDSFLYTSTREASGRSSTANQLRHLGLANHNYHDLNEVFVSGIIYSENGKALHGWMTPLLPYLDYEGLFEEIDLTAPWDSKDNLVVFAEKPEFIERYSYPVRNEIFHIEHATGIKLPVAPLAANFRVFPRNQSLKLSDISDGTTQTLMCGEVSKNLQAWGQPGHLRDPALGLNSHPYGFGSNWTSQNVEFLRCDGGVWSLSNDIDPEVLKKLSTPNAGDEIPPGSF
ncbi:DUF1559 domain-containing protein [uncultured Rubinisphaera sp.]|uniref:DUF1559 family PulG-like putative transporter n=1 Tax=uncultured Rubinisphaera sp. TaxID=1678686 RepID=UPI0030DC0284